MRERTYQAILFDLDGVLIDSTACIIRHWREWSLRHDLKLERILEYAYGVPTVQTIRQVAPHLDAVAEARLFAELELNDSDDVVAMEGAAQLLLGLPDDTWAIVTSANRELAKARLEHAGLPIPDVLVSADDVREGKPSPEPYLAALGKLSLPASDCLAVEDSPAGIQAARGAGMDVIAVASSHPAKELLRANRIIVSLAELRVVTQYDENSGWKHQVI